MSPTWVSQGTKAILVAKFSLIRIMSIKGWNVEQVFHETCNIPSLIGAKSFYGLIIKGFSKGVILILFEDFSKGVIWIPFKEFSKVFIGLFVRCSSIASFTIKTL